MISLSHIPTRSAVLGLSLLLAACSDELPRELRLREQVERRQVSGEAGLQLPSQPQRAEVTLDGERRDAVLTGVAPWRWHGRVPDVPGARLHVGVQLRPELWDSVRDLQVVVTALQGRTREVLEVVRAGPESAGRWLDFDVDLAGWAGEEVTLELSPRIQGLAAMGTDGPAIAWAPVRIDAPDPAPRERPNVLFILVDTLRYDHLTPYGYPRETSPNIQRLLAERGLVVEEAYSQAPWTLPSVVSFLTGRLPGELLGEDVRTYGIPAGVQTLAEALAVQGYETGGFFANKALHAGNGFDRGFRTFYSPPAEMEMGNRPDAAELNARVLPWLSAHRNKPFFLYVHYIDPHDPYLNPETVDGISQFFPEYKGRLGGDWIQGIHTGAVRLEDPEADTRQIKALYDSEIHHVDRFIGELIESLPPEVLRDTLIVLTADHGEELGDHGGWKHGFTLYEDQIHVPLLLRWDGRIPAGRRLKGTVRLIDLMPTLAGAAGVKPSPSWQGTDLMPALQGRSPLPRLHAFAQHMMVGPLRAAVVLDRKKLILFNDQTPYAPGNPLEGHLWSYDLARLERVELYDLARDRAERRSLAAADPGQVGRLEPLIQRQLDRQAPGLRLMASGLPAGSRLEGEVDLDRAASGWLPWFLAEGDRVEVEGSRVRFALGGESLTKGVLLKGVSGIAGLNVTLDGAPLPAGGVTIGAGAPYGGGKAGAAALTAADWPAAPRGPALRLWLSRAAEGSETRRAAPADPETERRLRALGYIQ
jgi:arylsulfatase A-like enzyme